jgi:hypothetical protein
MKRAKQKSPRVDWGPATVAPALVIIAATGEAELR